MLLQITDLPFSLYSTFVIEARHGFNKVRVFIFESSSQLVFCIIYITEY